MRLIPREMKFFDLFNESAQTLSQGANLLRDTLLEIGSAPEIKIQKLKDMEHKGDEMMHAVIDKLNKTFITPIDREDIHRLASAMDDVLDFVYAAGERIVMYDIRNVAAPAQMLAEIIVKQSEQIANALKALEKPDVVLAHCKEVRKLEREADGVSRAAIAALFKQVKDPISLIKQKELYEFLEIATDRAEDVADVLESIAVKNA